MTSESGKSTSAALMAAAIAAQFYDRAPVYVVDPEAAWQFLKRRIFDVEGIELIQRPYSTFKDMVDSLHEAEKMGACCWIIDPLTLIWNELLDSFQQKLGYIPIDKWQDVRQLWNGDYIRYFLNCGMNCLALGRLGNDFEEREETLKNGETKTKLVKDGTKFKAGGGESFGYPCCWIVDPLTLIWNELLDSFQQKLGYIPVDNPPSSKLCRD